MPVTPGEMRELLRAKLAKLPPVDNQGHEQPYVPTTADYQALARAFEAEQVAADAAADAAPAIPAGATSLERIRRIITANPDTDPAA